MRKLDFTPKFKKEMSNIELEGIERILDTLSKNEESALFCVTAEHYGLAYTSSSSYAMYNVTEKIFAEFPDKEISHFAITENDMLIVVVHDESEKTFYYEIEPNEFY